MSEEKLKKFDEAYGWDCLTDKEAKRERDRIHASRTLR